MVNHLVLLIWCFLPTAWLFGIKFMCPKEFKNGVNTVSCKVNVTAIKDADCSSLQPSVTFHLTANSFRAMMCHAPHFGFSACAKEQNAGDCWCNRSDGDIFEYIFSYTANHTQDVGAKLDCELCALPNNYLDEQISNSCRSLKFENKGHHDNGDNKAHVPVWKVASAAVGVIITITILVVLLVCFRKQTRKKKEKVSNGKVRYSPEDHGEETNKINVIRDDTDT